MSSYSVRDGLRSQTTVKEMVDAKDKLEEELSRKLTAEIANFTLLCGVSGTFTLVRLSLDQSLGNGQKAPMYRIELNLEI